LFGKPFRKITKPQLINTITRKEMITELEFSINNINYKIVRGLKPTVFEVYQNGEMVNQDAEMKDYQEFLEKHILKINHKSFCQVVVLGSASFIPFMQLPGGQRREVIEDLLDLQIFTTMNSLLKDRIAENNEAIIKANAEQKFLIEKIDIVREHMIERQNNNEKIIEEKLSLIDETNIKIENLKQQLENVTSSITILKDKTVNKDEVSKKVNKLTKLRHQIEAKVALIQNDVEFFKNHDNCPTCTQVIDENLKQEKIAHKEGELEEINIGLTKLSEEFEKTQNELNEIMETVQNIADFNVQSMTITNQITSLTKYTKELAREINNIKKQQDDSQDLKISELEAEMNEHEIKYNALVEDRNVLMAASNLLKDGGIKSRIIKQYVPVINKLISKYLSAMDFFVQFELDEEFNETIKSRFRDEFSYASFSEGEKMRINLAILFTWRSVAKLRNSISTNLLIMDEVMDSSMDSNGTDEFLKILNNLAADTNTFIISHKTDQLYDKFTNVIKFEKHKNFSKVA